MVVLEILGTKIEDTGTYTCRATNKWGKAEISVNLECIERVGGQKPHFTSQLKVKNYFIFEFFLAINKSPIKKKVLYEFIKFMLHLYQIRVSFQNIYIYIKNSFYYLRQFIMNTKNNVLSL